MGAQLRQLRTRIRSVRSTAKITRAQELIAASKISRAQARQAASTPYALEITRAVSALISHQVPVKHALLNRRPDASRVAVLLVTSDRGFCGAYNNNVLRHGEQLAALLREQGKEPVFYVTGQRGIDHFRFQHRPVAGQWEGLSGAPTYALADEIGRRLVDAFTQPTADGGVGEVHIVYTKFVSMLAQELTVRRLLPIEVEDVTDTSDRWPPSTYEFEPTAHEVLDGMINQYIRGRLQQHVPDPAASEHGARRAAMMAATDNANDLITDLTRRANVARQGDVTTELNEIVSGANALAEGK